MSLRLPLSAITVAAVVGYAWWVTSLQRFTWPMRMAVGLPAFLVLAAAYVSRGPRTDALTWWRGVRHMLSEPHHRAEKRGFLVWISVIALLLGFEFFTYAMSPRADWPTMSSLLHTVEGSHPVRVVLFLLWVFLGLDLLRR